MSHLDKWHRITLKALLVSELFHPKEIENKHFFEESTKCLLGTREEGIACHSGGANHQQRPVKSRGSSAVRFWAF